MRIDKDNFDTTWMSEKIFFEIAEKRKSLFEQTIDAIIFILKLMYPIITIIIIVFFIKNLLENQGVPLDEITKNTKNFKETIKDDL